MEPSAADRHSLGHDRPSSSEGRRAPYWLDGAADVAETTYRACLRSI